VSDATIIANLALDRVDGGEWTPGGCPTFARPALAAIGAQGTLITSCGVQDRARFADTAADELVLDRHTTRFEIDYSGDERAMVLHSIGHRWMPEDVARLSIETEWVHLAPLTRADFPVETVAALAGRHRVCFDGQGLVRRAHIGPLELDAEFDPQLLTHLSALKLADDEAGIVGRGASRDQLAERLGVPELIFSHGSRGAALWCQGTLTEFEPQHVARGNVTGAGDTLMTAFVVGRERGHDPVQATRAAMDVVENVLKAREERRA